MSTLFAERCITGLTANVEHLRELAESSPSIVTPLNSAIGYDTVAAVVNDKEASRLRVYDVRGGRVQSSGLVVG